MLVSSNVFADMYSSFRMALLQVLAGRGLPSALAYPLPSALAVVLGTPYLLKSSRSIVPIQDACPHLQHPFYRCGRGLVNPTSAGCCDSKVASTVARGKRHVGVDRVGMFVTLSTTG